MTTETLSIPLTHRLEAADAHEAATGLQGVASLLGDDGPTLAKSFGRAIAILSVPLATSLYNRVIGFDEAALHRLDEVIELYHAHGLPARFDLVPQFVTEPVASALQRRGFELRPKPVFSNLMMVREAEELSDELPEGMTIETVTTDTAELFGEIHAAGLNYEPSVATMLGRQLTTRMEAPDTIGFLARLDGVQAGTGLLTLVDGIGYFGHASTRPEHRGRGCQTALLRARISEAKRQGCDYLVTFPVPDTPSHRNVERCGFVVGHRMEIWMDIDADRE